MMYEKLYHLLFNAITDALEELGEANLGRAEEILVTAQRQAEERYLEGEDAQI